MPLTEEQIKKLNTLVSTQHFEETIDEIINIENAVNIWQNIIDNK